MTDEWINKMLHTHTHTHTHTLKEYYSAIVNQLYFDKNK